MVWPYPVFQSTSSTFVEAGDRPARNRPAATFTIPGHADSCAGEVGPIFYDCVSFHGPRMWGASSTSLEGGRLADGTNRVFTPTTAPALAAAQRLPARFGNARRPSMIPSEKVPTPWLRRLPAPGLGPVSSAFVDFARQLC